MSILFSWSRRSPYKHSHETRLLNNTAPEEPESYMQLCWEAEQDARFALGISNDKTGVKMRAGLLTPGSYKESSLSGSPRRNAMERSGEIGHVSQGFRSWNTTYTDLGNQQSKNDRIVETKNKVVSGHDHLSSTLAEMPSRRDVGSTSVIETSKAIPVTKDKNKKDTFTLDDHLEDLRASLIGKTESAGGKSTQISRPVKSLDTPIKRNPLFASKSESNIEQDDCEGTDDEVAFLTGYGSRPTIHEQNNTDQSDIDSLLGENPSDRYYEANKLAQIRRMENDDRTKFSFVSRAMRNPMRKFNFPGHS